MEELDEPDINGLTPLMHALSFGQDAMARKLILKGVDVKAQIRVVAGEPAIVEEKTMLKVALEQCKELATIDALVRAGALTGIPRLDDEHHTSAAMIESLTDESHAIGLALSLATTQVDFQDVDDKYRAARSMLIAAFAEAPGAALCGYVCLAFTMRGHATAVHLTDFDLSEHLYTEAREVGKSVGVLLKMLPDVERERLLQSVPGENFLRFAAESECRQMLFSPVVTKHIQARWMGDYMYAISTGEGAYQWGGLLTLSNSTRVWLSVFAPIIWLFNIALLPLVALFPGSPAAARVWLEQWGSYGVDPRESPQRPEGKRGYSPTLSLWWHSLILFDVPAFKFMVSQAGSAGLLVLLLYLAPCFDFDNHSVCFESESIWHMIGDGDDAVAQILKALFSFDPDPGHSARRALKGGRGAPVAPSGEEGDAVGSGIVQGTTPNLHIPHLFGFSKDAVYLLLAMYALAVFESSIRAKASIATAHTYASAVAALLAIFYLILDLVPLYQLDLQYDLQPMALSMATFLIWMDVARAVLLKTYVCGPSVLMLLLMFRDVAVFLLLALAIAVGFALPLFFTDLLTPSESSTLDPTCPFITGNFMTYSVTLIEDMLGLGGVADQIGCSKRETDFVSTVVLEGYLVVGAILLLNMLIAMMAETFSEVRARQEEEYAYLNAQIVVSVDFDSGNVPAPLSILRVPAKLLQGVGIVQKFFAPPPAEYKVLDGPTPAYKDYSLPPVEDILEKMEEVDFASEKDSIADLLLSIKADLIESGSITNVKRIEKIVQKEPMASDVQVFDGFAEDASRLVFPYGDHFQHVVPAPEGRTYLPSGIAENEAKKIPVTPEDEAPDKSKGEEDMTHEQMLAKLKTRGLVAYPFAQSVNEKSARNIIAEAGDVYVFERQNGTFGLSQIWPIKVNDVFYKKFVCSTTNPNPKVFQPQAVDEFKRSIDLLFGQSATKKVPVIYAQNKNLNALPIYKGNSLALQKFLRKNPEACDRLKIAKLFPGGFVATIAVGGNPKKGEPPKKNSFKHFDFTPGVEYVLYTKQGYEVMSCIKSYEQFKGECTVGERLVELEMSDAPSDADGLAISAYEV